jgi:tRNA G18 (ribose-2'-O)-methylase SpoU
LIFAVPLIHRITSLDLPELHPYKTLRRPQEHLDQGIFVAEGEKVVRRLLASTLPTISLLLTDQWLARISASYSKQLAPDIFVAEKQLLETIVGFRMHQGIMAVGRVPREPSLDDLVDTSRTPRLFVALDGLVFAENVGVVVRNCAAFGVQGILVAANSASPYLRRAVRNSMGTVFRIPLIHTPVLSETLTALHSSHGMSVVVADAHTRTSLYELDSGGDLCIVLGNEDAGASETVRSVASHVIRIPMTEGVDSLNVASASAVILAEVARQRQTTSKK